jgi:integration host factor subunit beta
MTKTELAHEVADNSDLNKKQAEVAVQAVLDSIVEALQSGDKVEVRGFGSFRLRKRRPRIARNPKTGESVS